MKKAKQRRSKKQQGKTGKKKMVKKRVIKKSRPKMQRKAKVVRRPVTKKAIVKQKITQQKPGKPVTAQPVQQFQKELLVGAITHYFTHLSVGILDITNTELAVGDKIHIQGATTNFVQTVASMQVDRNAVEKAVKGQSIGLKVNEHVREHDKVYKIVE